MIGFQVEMTLEIIFPPPWLSRKRWERRNAEDAPTEG
jgi:hypothetical protein